MTTLRSWPVAVAAAALLAACSSTPLDTKAPVATAAPAAPAPTPAPSDGATAAPAPAASTVPEYLDPNSPLASKRSVFFDYDDYTIKSEYADVVATQGKYLSPHPAVHIRIEGNADERGSAE